MPTRCLLVVLFVFGLLTTSCDDAPTKPAAPKDYAIYAAGWANPSTYFAYHPSTGKMDTFVLPYETNHDLAVSADGQRLYIATQHTIEIVDPQTKETITSLPHGVLSLKVSSDNKYVALLEPDSLLVYRTADYSVVYADSCQPQTGVFTGDAGEFYYIQRDSVWRVMRLDLGTFQSEERAAFPNPVACFASTSDEKTWFLLSYLGQDVDKFEMYDVSLDSVVFREYLWPGYG